MGENGDDINASIAHVVLCCVACKGVSRMQSRTLTPPGMHANFFIHGVLGFLHYQSGLHTQITHRELLLLEKKYLSVTYPHGPKHSSYSAAERRGWAVFSDACSGGVFKNDFKQAYQVSHMATRYLALPCLNADLHRRDSAVSSLHLVSGLIPFAIALSGNDNVHLGNLVIACNIISLAHYSFQNKREWGWYTVGAGLFAYFVTPKMGPKILYPLGLALMEFCAYKLFQVNIDSTPQL